MKQLFGIEIDGRENKMKVVLRYTDGSEIKMNVQSLSKDLRSTAEKKITSDLLKNELDKKIDRIVDEINASITMADELKKSMLIELMTKESVKRLEKIVRNNLISRLSIEMATTELSRRIANCLLVFEGV